MARRNRDVKGPGVVWKRLRWPRPRGIAVCRDRLERKGSRRPAKRVAEGWVDPFPSAWQYECIRRWHGHVDEVHKRCPISPALTRRTDWRSSAVSSSRWEAMRCSEFRLAHSDCLLSWPCGTRWLTRDLVAGTLWPEVGDEQAGASLRSAISHLEPPVRESVRVTAHDLSLAEGVIVDVHGSRAMAHRLIDRDAPRSETDIAAVAVSALSADLLPGWYDDWAVIAAEDWHQLRINALEAVAARLTAADRLAEAADAALAAVRAEPLRESAWAALIRVHMAEGNQYEATGEYERYRVLLRAELGLEPTSRLTQLLASLDPR